MLERAICLNLFCPRYQISLRVFTLGAFCTVKTDKIAMFPSITYFYNTRHQSIDEIRLIVYLYVAFDQVLFREISGLFLSACLVSGVRSGVK